MPSLEDIDAQIRALEDQKKQIQQKAKEAALAKANAAIEELRKMGYSYRLVSDGAPARTASTGGTRRTGQRDAVLTLVQGSAGGITAADVLKKMGATSDADKTSVRNALSALKRNGKVELKDGKYIAK